MSGQPEQQAGPDPRTLAAWQRHLGEAVPPQLRRDLAAGTLPEAVRQTAEQAANRIALVVDGAEASHALVRERMDAAAALLTIRGVRTGDRVLICAANSLDLVTGYLGVLAAGATVVLASPSLTTRELATQVAASQAVLVLAGPDEHHRLAEATSPRLGTWPLAGLADAPSVDAGVPKLGSDQVAVLAFTSGTTGQPKGVPLTHANLLSSIRSVMAAWRWQDDDVLVHALPLSHQHGLGGVHAALLSGSTTVVHGRFDPERLVVELRDRPGSVLFAVPAVYERLVTQPGFDAAALPVLRLAVSGSAPLPSRLAEAVADRLGIVPLERYGTTESGLDVSNLYDGPRRPGKVGIPLPGVEVSLCDTEGHPVGVGSEGEICVRGPQVFSGYWNQPEETAQVFWPDGWFRTGDVGVVDPDDGYLAIVGRIKELIITGGLNVYPAEVEQILASHDDVAEVAVAGLPSPRWGEQVTAFVVARPGADVDAAGLIAHARAHLAAYKCPKQVVTVPALPRNAMGKVVRARLIDAMGDTEGETA